MLEVKISSCRKSSANTEFCNSCFSSAYFDNVLGIPAGKAIDIFEVGADAVEICRLKVAIIVSIHEVVIA